MNITLESKQLQLATNLFIAGEASRHQRSSWDNYFKSKFGFARGFKSYSWKLYMCWI